MTMLFHASDLHFGRADLGALAWFAAAVEAEKPDAVIITGDLTMRARRAEFAAAEEWLQGLRVPVTLEPGNHDLPHYNPVARFLEPYDRFHRLKAAVEQPLELADIDIVPLKTTARAQLRLNWAEGQVNQASLHTALRQIRRNPPGVKSLVACHHPLVDTAGTTVPGRTRGGVPALSALASAGVLAVLSGHVHDGFDRVVETSGGPIRMIGAGTLSERIRRDRPSFNRLHFAHGKLQTEVQMMPANGSAR